jgi:hypothetical protein
MKWTSTIPFVAIYCNFFLNLKLCSHLLFSDHDTINWTYTIAIYWKFISSKFWDCCNIPVLGHDPTTRISNKHIQFLLLQIVVIFLRNLKFLLIFAITGSRPYQLNTFNCYLLAIYLHKFWASFHLYTSIGPWPNKPYITVHPQVLKLLFVVIFFRNLKLCWHVQDPRSNELNIYNCYSLTTYLYTIFECVAIYQYRAMTQQVIYQVNIYN